jgi:hypothetical protein
VLCIVVSLAFFALVVRACNTTPTPFVVRVVESSDARVCLKGVDGGPTAANGCHATEDIVDLPTSLAVGVCIEVVESHPLLHYLGIHDCGDGSS